MITLTSVEIENLAMQIKKMKTAQEMVPILGDLRKADRDAVLACVMQLHDEEIAEAQDEANSWENLQRLAEEAGCPDGVKILPWLQERGLAVQVDGAWRFKKPKRPVVTGG